MQGKRYLSPIADPAPLKAMMTYYQFQKYRIGEAEED
jgi:hypothetical protein